MKFAIVKTFFIIRYNEEYFKGTMEKVENYQKKEKPWIFQFHIVRIACTKFAIVKMLIQLPTLLKDKKKQRTLHTIL